MAGDNDVNPDELHPYDDVSNEMRHQWHKMLGLLMYTRGIDTFEVFPKDIQAMGEGMCVVADARNNRLVIRLVTIAEAERMRII